MTVDIGAIEAYLHWQSLRSMSEVDASPTAYYEHLENLKNAEKLEQIRKLNLSGELEWLEAQDSSTPAGREQFLRSVIANVLDIVGREETHDAGTAG